MTDSARIPASAAPEAVNREQDDEAAQAQTVAETAQHERPLADSVKPNSGGDSDDAQDLVDHIHQMKRSGVIDMDAYRGEPSENEDGEIGPGGIKDNEPRGAP